MTAQICNYVTPPLLYRYRSLRSLGKKDVDVFEREMTAIEQNYLWCSDFGHLNDPMEGTFVTTSRVRASKRYRQARKAITDGKAGLGLCAFSETNNNELMWAHYSDEFSGICIAYRFTRLREILSNEFTFSRISYTEKPPKMSNPDDKHASLESDVRKILSTKGYRWLYEREWRMFAPHPGKNDYRAIASRPISTVYIGFRTPEAKAEEIERRMNEIGINTRRMKLSKYAIEFPGITRSTTVRS